SKTCRSPAKSLCRIISTSESLLPRAINCSSKCSGLTATTIIPPCCANICKSQVQDLPKSHKSRNPSNNPTQKSRLLLQQKRTHKTLNLKKRASFHLRSLCSALAER